MFLKRFVSGCLFVSPCRPGCFLHEMKIEPGLRLTFLHISNALLVTAVHVKMSSFYRISNLINFIPKYLVSTNIEVTIEGKSSRERFRKNSFQHREIRLEVK